MYSEHIQKISCDMLSTEYYTESVILDKFIQQSCIFPLCIFDILKHHLDRNSLASSTTVDIAVSI